MLNNLNKKIFTNHKKKVFILFLLLLLLFFLFNFCKITNFDLLISKKCGDGFKIELIRLIKSNKQVYNYIDGVLRYITYKTDLIIPHHKLIQFFQIENYEDSIKKNKVDDNLKITGIQNNRIYFTNNNLFHDRNETFLWKRSHGGHHNLKFNESNDINYTNVANLKLKWSFQSIEKKNLEIFWKQNIQANPILINKKLISIFPDFFVRAFDASTGKFLWKININGETPTRRGMVAEEDEFNNENLYISFGKQMFKINAQNGKVIKKFGNEGSIKVDTLLAPCIFKDKLIVINKSNVEIYNKNTGKKISRINFHENKNFLGGDSWGGSALDEKTGKIFVATGNPFPTTYGAQRDDKNANSNSVIAIDLIKQKILWSFRETLHDLWNLDIPSPPILHNLKFENKIIETVIVPSKTGNTLILERNSGKLVFDAYYKKVAKSDVLGEPSSPYQIYIEKPERFSKIEFGKEDIDKLTDAKKEEIINKIKQSKYGWFEPPSYNKNLIMFGIHGGAQWQGAALDPLNQYLYIPVNNQIYNIKLYFSSIEPFIPRVPEEFMKAYNFYNSKCATCHGKYRNGIIDKEFDLITNHIPSLVGTYFKDKNYNNNLFSKSYIEKIHKFNLKVSDEEIVNLKKFFYWWDKKIYKEKNIVIHGDYRTISEFLTSDGLPASNPPWGYIAKINLVTGKLLYKTPIGFINNDLIGTPIYGGIAANGGRLIFANGTEDAKAYAIDAENGKILWTYQMEAPGTAPPIIFNIDGKQYVSFLSTGGGYSKNRKKGSTLYTFAIN